jgi:hypothetical protein
MRGANARSTHPVLIPLQRPLAGDLALARPEAVTVPAGDVARAEAAVVPATEAEGLARHRHADVHAAHAGLHATHHAARDVAAGGVDAARVAVGVRVLDHLLGVDKRSRRVNTRLLRNARCSAFTQSWQRADSRISGRSKWSQGLLPHDA